MDVQSSTDIGELAKALSAAQAEITAASKDKLNPHFDRKYADLASVWEACRGPLTKHGLSVVQLPLTEGEMVGVSTTLMHSSGQWIRGSLWGKPERSGPQALVSCVTYFRRTALAAVAGVAPDDDDGNAAQGSGNAKDRPPAKRADKVPAQPSAKKATPEQIKIIHVLKSKTGTDDGAYQRGLAAYKDADGKPVTTSKDLTEEQAANLIQRLENLDARKQQALAGMQAQEGENLKSALDRPASKQASMLPSNGNGSDALASQIKAKGLTDVDVSEYVLAPFGADSIDQLEEEDKPKALSLLLAFTQGKEPYCAVMAKLGFSTEHIQ